MCIFRCVFHTLILETIFDIQNVRRQSVKNFLQRST
eukprot:UN15020